MKATLRSSVFETNSSTSHSYIRATKETFEAWRRGEVILDLGNFGDEYGERDFIRMSDSVKKKIRESEDWEYGTYEDVMDYMSKLWGDTVLRKEADERYADPEEMACSGPDDCVSQRAYVEIIDNGKDVMIHAWGCSWGIEPVKAGDRK
ncbi:MAG: hypothetical protein LBH69_04895 [Methanomassiliicoccaceae archaeon]|nr:hypothetical protein [Methanomassiliicoccaceae archaeon]